MGPREKCRKRRKKNKHEEKEGIDGAVRKNMSGVFFYNLPSGLCTLTPGRTYLQNASGFPGSNLDAIRSFLKLLLFLDIPLPFWTSAQF